MNPLDRFYETVNLNPVDRPLVIPQATYCVAKWLSLDLYRPAHDAELMAEALIKGWKLGGYEGIYVGWEASFNILAEAFGAKLETPAGGLPKVSKPLIEKLDDIENLNLPTLESGRIPLHLNALKLVKKKVEGKIPILSYVPGPITLSSLLLGINKMIRTLYFNDKRIDKLLELACKASIRFAEAKAEEGADVVIVADPIASLLKPSLFKNKCKPYINLILEKIEKKKIIPSLHICGDTSKILKYINQCKTKIFELDALVDLTYAKRVLNKKCIMGNLSTTLIMSGDPGEIQEKVRESIKKAGKIGYIVSSGCEIPYGTPLENVKAMVYATLKFHDF